MKTIWIILAVGLMLVSCKKTASDAVAVDVETQVEAGAEECKIEDLFFGFELIPLNTGQEGMFGSIDKLTFYNGRYYIMDKTGKRQVLVFDREGNYERSIGQAGKGHGEYTNIEDFTIDKENNRIVILAYPSSVYVYDMDGRFLEQKRIEEHSMLWDIASCKDGFVCSTNHQTYTEGEHAFLLYFFDKDFKFLAKRIPVLPKQVQLPPFISRPLMETGEGKLAYFDTYTASLYSIDTSDSIAVRRHAYMPDNLMPAECFADPNEFASKQMTYAFFLSAMCPDNRLLAFYASGGEIRGFITDRENSADKVKSFKFNGWVPPLMDYADGMFYSVISARQAEVCKDLFEEMPDSLAEQANEMILRFRLASAD